jgi:uncharacterized protein YraI
MERPAIDAHRCRRRGVLMFRNLVLLLLVFILSACNFPTRQQPVTQETLQAGFVQTAAALTAAAPPVTDPQFQQPLPELPAPVTPVPGFPLPAAQPAVFSPPAVQTGLPVVTVSVNTNCRSGPARAYTLIGWLLVGEQAVVVGQNQQLNYWIIQNPRSPGTCWLWGRYATVFGDLSQVPHIEFPAATPGVPITGPPYLNVTVPTNCRTGPGPQFPIVGLLPTGQSAFILGRDAPGIWWLIQHPAGIGNCWVWGGYARITGNIAGIPITSPVPIPPPQPPTPVPPAGHFLAVSVNSNCHTGPSPQFPTANYLLVGQYAPVLGRNPEASWWLIQNPNQAGLSCWVWGRFATLWGDFGTIPVIPPTGPTPVPPTPVPPTPVPPTPIPPVTPIPGQPYVMANVNTNCRSAPSPRQPAVGTLLAGQQASIFGRNLLGDWWFVQLPTFPEVQCWVWGQNMVVFGDTSQVPVLPVVGFGIDPNVAEVDPVVPQVDPVVPQPVQPLPQVTPAAPQTFPVVPNVPLVSTPVPTQVAPQNPLTQLFDWLRRTESPEFWAPTLAPPEILIQPIDLTPVSPLVQPTPIPPLIQPVVPTPEPVLPTPIPPPVVQPATPVGAEECIILNQTVTFGQAFTANTPFTANWSILNTGSSTWNPGEVSARYLSGDVVHTVAEVPLVQAVPPGSTVGISVPAVAPGAPQTYSALWGMTRGAEVLCNLFLVIEVP